MYRTRTDMTVSSSNNNNNKDSAMLDFMSRMPNSSPNTVVVEELSDDIVTLVHTIAKAADDRKADDIVALNVRGCTTLCSALVLVSGNSRPQNNAIVAAIRETVEERVGLEKLPEGTADSGWIILDYGSVMVHVMTPKSRLYYNVEGQWKHKGGHEMNLSDDGVLVPNSATDETNAQQQLDISKEQDPFWS